MRPVAFPSLQAVIDLHSHILPGIDDGAADLSVALDMARASVADGVTVLACTPHILPGLYHNTGPRIREAVQELQTALDDHGIALQLVTGADVHIVPDFIAGLRSGHLLSLADSRYVLVEPPHHVAPPRLDDLLFRMMAAGYVPIITHPERLTWVRSQYDTIREFVRRGVWMQITAGSLAGRFGRGAQYWAERMLDEGCVHILATDAHDTERRPPDLGEGRELAARRVGTDEAEHLVATRPKAIVGNQPPSSVPMPAANVSSTGVANAQGGTRMAAQLRADRGEVEAGAGLGHAGSGGGFARRLRQLFE